MPPILSLCDGYQLALADYARTGLRVGIWASSGRGKSFGVGVLCEELLAAEIPVIAVDPEGELHTLREQFRVLVVGGAEADLPLPPGPAAIRLALARALDEGLGLVVDLSEKPSSRSQQEAARPWLEQLWMMLSEKPMPVALVVEEVHIFAPQSGSALTADIMQRFAKQGRKRGAILVAASQRTQAVSKEFMSQLNFPAIGGFETERDYEAVKAVVDGHSFDEFRALEPGRFYLPAAGGFFRWRPRRTSHGGSSPDFTAAEVPDRPVRDATLDDLVEQLRAAFERDEPDQPAGLPADRARIRELEQALAGTQAELTETKTALSGAREEISRLKTALQVAGLIKVQITQEVIARAPELPVPTQAVQAATGTAGAPAPAVTVAKVEAKPLPPSLKDFRLSPEQMLAQRDVSGIVRKARARASRRIKGASQWGEAIATTLLRGTPVNPTEFAGWYGYKGRTVIRRIEVMLDALVEGGIATYKGGWYRLNEPYLIELLRGG